MISKCNTRLGFLFARLPLRSIPFPVAVSVFNIYILPVLTYALPAWFPGASASSKKKLNVVFSKFLKRYLGVPYSANNAIVYKLTGSSQLINSIESLHMSRFLSCTFPPSMNGLRFSPPIFTTHTSPPLPDYFSDCPVTLTKSLPILPFPRRALAYDFLDLFHGHMCWRGFHSHSDMEDPCFCTFCDSPMYNYHRFSCPAFFASSPSLALKEIVDKKK